VTTRRKVSPTPSSYSSQHQGLTASALLTLSSMTSSIYAASSPARSIYRVFPFLFANVFSYYLTLALDVDVTRFFICRITAGASVAQVPGL
jgi:hypothetical protein